MKRRTKIICTIGPASASEEMLVRLITAGMDVARLNFSHGTHEEHRATIGAIRRAASACGRCVGILLDLQGPKIRIGKMADGGAMLDDGARFVITTDASIEGTAERASTTYKALATDVAPGMTILLDDGYIALEVVETHRTEIVTRVVKGGLLKSNKGIVVPGARISAPALSEKDLDDARFGAAEGVDAVALSFVSSERDIIELRSALKVFGRPLPVIAKIERMEGISDIEDIVVEADGIMIARGDLGLELPAERVPVLQKHIIARCNYYGKFVITATQMLESMIENPRPTRAEASDVANAVIDGTDCVMLSGETSVGRYPVESVETMVRIITTTEEEVWPGAGARIVPADEQQNIADAIGRASCEIAAQVGASVIVTLTDVGDTARIIAKYRPRTPILALTDNTDTLRRLSFVWGIKARYFRPFDESDPLPAELAATITSSGMAAPGDLVVLSAGRPLPSRPHTNSLIVFRV